MVLTLTVSSFRYPLRIKSGSFISGGVGFTIGFVSIDIGISLVLWIMAIILLSINQSIYEQYGEFPYVLRFSLDTPPLSFAYFALPNNHTQRIG